MNMVTNFQNFENPFRLEEGVKPALGLNEFSRIFGSNLNESEYGKSLLEKSHFVYEFGLLFENRKSWFDDQNPIYHLDGEGHKILFKNGSIFIITNESFNFLNLNEGFWDDVTDAWNSVKATAKSVVNTVSSAASQTWDAISDGAKKAWEFAKRITAAAAKFVSEDPLTSAAIFLQLMSGIVSFIPAAGQIAGPIMLGIAGALEVYMGSQKIGKAWNKFSDIEISKISKGVKSFTEGAPLLIAGIVSMMLGLNDVVTAPKSAIPGAGASSLAIRSAATKWSNSFAGSFSKTTEHFLANLVGKAVKTVGPSLTSSVGTFMGKGGSAIAATAVSMLFLKVGKEILGGLFTIVISALKNVTSAFSFVLSLPSKVSQILEKIISSATSTVAKILVSPLKFIINPVVKFLGKMIDSYIKPLVDKMSKFFENLVKDYKTLETYSDKIDVREKPLASTQPRKIEPQKVQTNKGDLSKIKKLPKANESRRIKGFQQFGSNRL